jgi:phage tail-like protein
MANDVEEEFLGSQFALEIDGVEIARFSGVSGLSYSAEVVEYNEIVEGKLVTHKRPGRTKYDDIVLKRGLSASTAAIDWFQHVQDGEVQRQNGSIVIYDRAGNELGRWNFERGWPSKWSGGDMDAGSDDIMIEELTITHEFLKRA